MTKHEKMYHKISDLKYAIEEMEKKYGDADEYIGGQKFLYREFVECLQEAEVISKSELEQLRL